MANTIAELKTALGAGAKVAKFTVTFPAITGVSLPNGALLCKSATFPSVKLGTTDVYLQGRKVVIPGDTEYSNTWGLDFYNTVTHDLRVGFIKWMSEIDNFSLNTKNCVVTDYMVDLQVHQLGCNGETTATYELKGCFPIDVQDVNLDATQINTVQDFRVDFAFTSWNYIAPVAAATPVAVTPSEPEVPAV